MLLADRFVFLFHVYMWIIESFWRIVSAPNSAASTVASLSLPTHTYILDPHQAGYASCACVAPWIVPIQKSISSEKATRAVIYSQRERDVQFRIYQFRIY